MSGSSAYQNILGRNNKLGMSIYRNVKIKLPQQMMHNKYLTVYLT